MSCYNKVHHISLELLCPRGSEWRSCDKKSWQDDWDVFGQWVQVMGDPSEVYHVCNKACYLTWELGESYESERHGDLLGKEEDRGLLIMRNMAR